MREYNPSRQRPRVVPPRSAQEPTSATERPDRVSSLIDRRVLHNTRPFFKGLLAACGWANSLGTTVACAIWIELQIRGSYSWLGATIGVIVAVVLTLAQVYTSDASPGGYLVSLLPDVLLTAAPHYIWLAVVFKFFFGELAGMILAGIGAFVIGYWSARLPELLIFGRRRAR